MENMMPQIFADTDLCCGEGPLWDAARNRMLYVDSDRTFLFSADEAGTEHRTLVDDVQVSSVALAKTGYILLGDQVWHLNPETGEKQFLLDSLNGEKLFFNDCIVGPDGRIYAGTYYWTADGMAKTGKLLRLEKGCEPVILDEGIELSNGLAFSADDSILYYSDSAKKTIFCYDFDKIHGTVSHKRVFARSQDGIPDGITSDAEGFIWSAMWYEGAVYRFDPDGKVERILRFPARQTSSVGFGGRELDTLYVTSAGALFESPMIPPAFDRNAYLGGKVFCLKPGVKGRREYLANY